MEACITCHLQHPHRAARSGGMPHFKVDSTLPAHLPWQTEVTAAQFDAMALRSTEIWKAVCQACACRWDGAKPHLTTWSPQTKGTHNKKLRIPLITLLRDVMACAPHPVAFTPALFAAVHGKPMRYAIVFEDQAESDETEKATVEAMEEAETEEATVEAMEEAGEAEESEEAKPRARRATFGHLGRSLMRFATAHMVPLWTRLLEVCGTEHFCKELHVLVTLPIREGPNLHLTLQAFKEDVTVFYPNTLDKPGQRCLLPVPSKFLRLTHVQPPVPVQVLDTPARTPWQVSCSSCVCCCM